MQFAVWQFHIQRSVQLDHVIYSHVLYLHSLLDILADRKGGGGITGDIIVNGEPRPNNFRYASGYVPQVQ